MDATFLEGSRDTAATPTRPAAIVGIDLGTTNSCVGVWKNGEVEILASHFSENVTPSFVHFGDGYILAGKAAKDKRISCPKETIFDAKRMLGRKFTDPQLNSYRECWPFELVPGMEDPSEVEISLFNGKVRKRPVDVSAEMLRSLRELAEDALAEVINPLPSTEQQPSGSRLQAVLTHPAHFGQAQLADTREAARLAGIEVVEMLSEPQAAALAFHMQEYHEWQWEPGQRLLVFDLGGGTFDATLMEVGTDGKTVSELIDGDPDLGGRDFDTRIMAVWCRKVAEIGQELRVDGVRSARVKARLLAECESAKVALSKYSEYRLPLSKILMSNADRGRVLGIERSEFEQASTDLLDRLVIIVERLLAKASITPAQVDKVLLVGGACRMPMVEQRVASLFGQGRISKRLHLDVTVAEGAAVRAAQLSQSLRGEVPSLRFLKSTPLSLGADSEGEFKVLIKQDSQLPVEGSWTFYTVANSQRTITFQIYEGLARLSRDNRWLCELESPELPPAPAGQVGAQLTLKLSAEGRLTVVARVLGEAGVVVQSAQPPTTDLVFSYRTQRASNKEAERMKRDSKGLNRSSGHKVACCRVKSQINGLLQTERLKVDLNQPTTMPYPQVEAVCTMVEEWMESGEAASMDEHIAPRHFGAVKQALIAMWDIRGMQKCRRKKSHSFPAAGNINKRKYNLLWGLMGKLRKQWKSM